MTSYSRLFDLPVTFPGFPVNSHVTSTNHLTSGLARFVMSLLVKLPTTYTLRERHTPPEKKNPPQFGKKNAPPDGQCCEGVSPPLQPGGQFQLEVKILKDHSSDGYQSELLPMPIFDVNGNIVHLSKQSHLDTPRKINMLNPNMVIGLISWGVYISGGLVDQSWNISQQPASEQP